MKTFTTLTTALLLASSAIASPLDTRSEKIEITTWSGDNCEGSSAHPSISGGTGCFESLPGPRSTSTPPAASASSIVYAGTDTGCLGVAFGSVELKC
ncbi:hypothetical protein BO70DRAFT_393579 [Aspergillus heteromorphus CBS 117.55]|uniref:Uncharacterized protein n=1 Tax=Aspergillus heteromorphus CBS 117.55 TaxID=1448321 RepID=A0A317WTD9_9EURO|nr:uncharacterized protein BO70DRAFT_393579 [Aspergillus heteromorphus CBS 117.55]PWY89061.1 hypothetical protein BO70DRAFT_393579 [Aspergillus heteromorphus CBS 117.55]